MPLSDLWAHQTANTRAVEKTRWRPVDLVCRSDESDKIKVRTKLVRSAAGAGMCIAETIGHRVLEILGLAVAPGHVVHIDKKFASALTAQFPREDHSEVRAGRHWGTTWMNAQPVATTGAPIPRLRDPADLFRMYLADVVVGNPDRGSYGNALLFRDGRKRQFDLIPIDQSECFNHMCCVSDPSELTRVVSKGLAQFLPGTEGVVMDGRHGLPAREVGKARAKRDVILQAVDIVPEEWYDRARVDPELLRTWMDTRLANLEALVNLPHWNSMKLVAGGAHVLNF